MTPSVAHPSQNKATHIDQRALVLALTSLLCGSVLLHLYVRELEERAGGGAKVPVVVTTVDAGPGTKLTREILGTRPLPQLYVESRHIPAVELDKLIGNELSAQVRANEALTWRDLAGLSDPKRSLSSLVRPGMRAFGVRTQQGALELMLEPGDRVDVVLVSNAVASVGAARTLLEGALVLSVDGRVEPGAGDEAAAASRRASGVLLAVTHEQGLTLAGAEGAGTFRLLLRNPDDTNFEARPAGATP